MTDAARLRLTRILVDAAAAGHITPQDLKQLAHDLETAATEQAASGGQIGRGRTGGNGGG